VLEAAIMGDVLESACSALTITFAFDKDVVAPQISQGVSQTVKGMGQPVNRPGCH